ncbi:MAG TPA: hypothetical protein VK084_00910 [Chitinophagaceae bacterium]|nr:hypothetical protein [Chitinophagaceae bacterium]
MIKTLYYFYFIVIASLFFAACNKESDDFGSDNSDTSTTEDVYKLKKIEYRFSGNESSIKPYKIHKKTLDFKNGTSVSQKIIVNPGEGLTETSRFRYDNLKNYSVIDTTGVAVPLSIDNKGNIYLGPNKWPFREKMTEMPSNLNLKDSVYVGANKKLHISIVINMVKYQCPFRCIIISKKSGKEIELNGVWQGSYPLNAKVDYKIQPL